MSYPAWATGAPETPAAPDGPLNHLGPAPEAPAPDAAADDAAAAHDPDLGAPPAAGGSGTSRARLIRMKREARIGIAALLSFLILVAVLLWNKYRDRQPVVADRTSKAPPVNVIPPRERPSTVAGTPPKTARKPPASAVETPPAPDPAPPAVVESAPAASTKDLPASPPPAVPREPIQLAMKEDEPAPPTPAPGAPKADAGPAATPPSEAPARAPDAESPAPAPAPPEAPPATAPAADPPLSAPPTTESPTSAAPPPTAPAADPTPAQPAPTPAPAAAPGPVESPAPAAPAPPPEAPATEPPASPTTGVSELGPTAAPAATPAPTPAPAPAATAPAATAPAVEPTTTETPGAVRQPDAPAPATDPALPPAPTAAPAADRLPTLTPPPDPAPAHAAASATSQGDAAKAVAATSPSPPPAPADPATGTWVPLRNLGKNRGFDDDRLAPEPEPEPQARAEPARESAGPAAGRAGETPDQVEPVAHVVQRGENFWTISRLYYGYGRYWKALWSANRATVPAADQLYVGQTIRIPAPEALDRALIEPERLARAAEPTPTPSPTSTLRKASRPADPGAAARPASQAAAAAEVELPTTDPFARRRPDDAAGAGSEPVEGVRPRRPRYKVRPYETLRSIARDTLGDSHRADEILDLNPKVITDPARLTPGQVLVLPDDAQIATGRRAR